MKYLKLLEKYDGRVRNDKWFRMVCPFHDDRSPSLDVDLTKPGFKCWGCSKTGNYVDLISQLEGVSATTAMAIIAEFKSKSGFGGARGKLGVRKVRRYLNELEILEKFAPVGKVTLGGEYLKDRKIDLRIAKKFGVRESNSFVRGWEDRVVFPIYDIDGNLCSVEGRDVTDSNYLRYRKWEGSQSGLGIFGINLVPKRLYSNLMFIVEGAIDVLSIWLSGYVALGMSSSDVSNEQLGQLKRITNYPVVLLDGIKPGTEDDRQVTFERLHEKFSRKFSNYSIVEIKKEDTDPNDLLKSKKLKGFLKGVISGIKK